MKGIEIAEKYYTEYGKPMLEKEFGGYAERITAGLVGEGSERYGFDDDISRDHDFEPGFCLFISEEDEKEFGFRLERAYAKLPKEFMGLKRQPLSPAGGNRNGVIVTENFYRRFLGSPNAPESLLQWLYIPSHSLFCAADGKIFSNSDTPFTEIRKTLLNYYPEDVRKKKLAAHLAVMAQAGEYNYPRLIRRKETGAARLALFEFVKSAISVIYLLNKKYEPFYKWAYRGMRELPVLSELELTLAEITELGNFEKQAEEKTEIIKGVALLVAAELKKQKLSNGAADNFSEHAFAVTDKIFDVELRNMHVMEGI